MARNWFESGSWNVWCMVCNRKIKSSEALKRWDGLIVCKEDYENRQPLDFLRTRQERITVPYSAPTSFTQFDGPVYLPYPACTQQGSSAMPSWAIAGCMRPSLAFPGNYLPTQPTDPDEPIHVNLLFVNGNNWILINGNQLITVGL